MDISQKKIYKRPIKIEKALHVISHEEILIKTTRRHSFIVTQITKNKKTIPNAGKAVEQLEFSHTTNGKVWSQSNIYPGPSNSTQGKGKHMSPKKTCSTMFIVTLFQLPTWKQAKHPLTEEQINKLRCMHKWDATQQQEGATETKDGSQRHDTKWKEKAQSIFPTVQSTEVKLKTDKTTLWW